MVTSITEVAYRYAERKSLTKDDLLPRGEELTDERPNPRQIETSGLGLFRDTTKVRDFVPRLIAT